MDIVHPGPGKGRLDFRPPSLAPSQSPLRRAQGQGGPGPHPLVDVLVDRVCALVESALEEKGAHCDG